MAQLSTAGQDHILKIREFLGLNENPDGDTHLKNGEFSKLQNFRITRDRHLQLRPGQRTVQDLRSAWDALEKKPAGVETPRFCGAWAGDAGGGRHILAAFGGAVWEVSPAGGVPLRKVGECTQDGTSFFGFGGKVYLLNGHEYMSWDGGTGTAFQAVEGYVPTVMTACSPAGAGTGLENVNRLTGKRRVKFSPDGKSAVFYLPEREVDEVDGVEGTALAYTLDGAAGTVTFASPPPAGINTVSVVYRKGEGAREEVERMRFSEFYNGAADTRVFLYGDGTSRTLYSGVALDTGMPSAEYFPDLYEAAVGDGNTPITAMVRHYGRMMVFKPGSAWSMEYNTAVTAAGGVAAVFYVLPVNRQIGNAAPGQARLLENNPLTLDCRHIYQWRAASSGGLAAGDRNAGRISDRVRSTLSGFDFSRTVTFNRIRESEFWFLYGGRALILNYAADAWYVYDNMPFGALLEVDGEVYGFTEAGGVRHISRQYRSDDGTEIAAEAETGAMDFDRDWILKYSPRIFAAIRPESGARVTVSVETNRRGDYPERLVSAGLAGFGHVDFGHFSFGTNRKPQVRRVKLKVKKATFCKLVFRSVSASATVTLLETDVQLRYAGSVK